ncbi:neprilysin [Xenopus laevis]|uniref:Neprilysin n=1 Tax=Xenopus laevis TaxID=8355 RepID=A0A8J1KSV4_XENLA|nr:neprilysin [Xenopus laevis]
MDIHQFSTAESKKKAGLSPLEKGLIILSIFLGIISIAMISAYATGKDSICTSQECVSTAARIIANMDTATDPCNDFYQYACGGWLKKNRIPDNNIIYNTFEILRTDIEVVIKDALEEESADDIPAIKKVKTFYKSCTDETTKNLRKGEPLIKSLTDLYDWPVAVDNWETRYGLTWFAEDSIAGFIAKYGRSGLMNVYVAEDLTNSSTYILHIDQPGLGLPSQEYYDCKDTSENACLAYMEQMILVAMLVRKERNLTINKGKIRSEMEKVFELEREIAMAEASEEMRENLNNIYEKMALSDIAKTYPLKINGQNINWLKLINTIISPGGVSVEENEQVVLICSDYLKKLRFLKKYKARELQNYLAWRYILSVLNDLSLEYKNTGIRMKKALYGTAVDESVWQSCITFLNDNMEDAVGRLYLKETLSADIKHVVKVKEIIADIRRAFLEMMEELEWMDEETKTRAARKAANIDARISFSEDIMDDLKLNESYSELEFKEDELFENKQKYIEFVQKKMASRLREQVNKHEWMPGPAHVNAFYSLMFNEIVFPAGILQPPFFSLSQPSAINYGGIGFIIGHEITHGFDNRGCNFDEHGHLVNWWTNGSMMNFSNLSQCFVNQYGNYSWDEAGGQYLNGISTLDENISDNGGIRGAYRAFKNYVKSHREEDLLPGIGLDRDQLFFLSFGQIWCGMHRPEYAATLIKTGSHTPGIFRVIGTLQNSPEFSKAFSCRNNAYMNPAVKCKLW